MEDIRTLYGRTPLEDMEYDTFIELIIPILQNEVINNKIGVNTLKLAVNFMHVKFNRSEAYRPLKDLVQKSIEEAMMYYVHVEDKDPETY